MKPFNLKTFRILALTIVGLVTALPAQADRDSRGGNKHEKHGQGRHEQQERHGGYEEHGRERGDDYRDAEPRFDDRYRTVINNYYAQEFRSGHCPPGLAKKHNGCMPPGQRRWVIGQPLPRDVVVYDLPPAVISQIGVPMPGYRYVRVANDVLMISIGSGMVMDAIRNLGGY